ncbi:FkbM family methyltransferase [Candidatus Dojkabacteria bacterium]|nr:FkbM family methyltransferase [Candidatus Dojkabacteria bacterium]
MKKTNSKKTLLEKIVHAISAPFIGSGISKRFPFIYNIFLKIYPLLAKSEYDIVKIPLDLKLKISTKDTGLGAYLKITGAYEPEETKVFIENVKKNNVIFDIGANIGYYSVIGSKIIGESGQVYAFEPDPFNLKLLNENITLNKQKNIISIPKAVGSSNQKISLQQDLNQGHTRVSTKEKSSQEIPQIEMITLDDFILENKISNVDYLKIDIEGYELYALEGAENSLGKGIIKTIMIEINPEALKQANTKWTELYALLDRYFELFILDTEAQNTLQKSTPARVGDMLKKVNFINIFGKSRGEQSR